ncbi:hypothetical protein ISU10_13480 [Nocardioides agariphilus]|uniref:Cupin domain-containing protein n=1 Tax=Nocardioides agariphilus TaxID=433664 RepID=A0A930YJ14_9ACTN|nr:hypothetical protein [Nocardioides agariphilus]MBF4768777.1 hypothetical protein [Nocardioides agariphilus]
MEKLTPLSNDKSYAFAWETLTTTFKDAQWEERGAEIGDTVMSIVRGKAGWDAVESFEDMPDGMCQCPHFGVVISGRIRIVTKDGNLECTTGDIYWQAPPHRVEWLEDSVLVEFSPSKEFWAFTEQAEATKNKLENR